MFSVIRISNNDDPSDNQIVVVPTGESKPQPQPYTTRTVIASGLTLAEAHRVQRLKMKRPAHYDDYEDIPEIVPGVFVSDADAVYIVDDEGEVCSWNSDEWEEDPSAVTATVNACILAATKGAAAVRLNIEQRGQKIEDLVIETWCKRNS